jgi:hypothetical protein
LCWLVSGDRRAFTATAGVDLAEVFDHAIYIGTISSLVSSPMGVLAAPASTSQLVLGHFRG